MSTPEQVAARLRHMNAIAGRAPDYGMDRALVEEAAATIERLQVALAEMLEASHNASIPDEVHERQDPAGMARVRKARAALSTTGATTGEDRGGR